MKKIIKKIGDSEGIIFNKDERKILNLHVGKIVDVILRYDDEEVQGKCL